ncbi:MAG TPA: hypothetical protein VGB75_05110 [Jatrophihabitans sp.]|jgi:hypothetical protein|uniref:hypothetical protein n=1 Tax=Jatrophihabitans sp. TaxID=1932789 RepID=UPI002EEBB386
MTTDKTTGEGVGQPAVTSWTGIDSAEPGSAEVSRYYDQVVAALAGLTPAARQDLIEDLPDHLAEVAAEVSAEGAGSLRERLGAPEVYAQELRAAAGLEHTDPLAGRALSAGVVQGLRRARRLADRFDLQAGRLVGYPRLVELLRATRPGWWVLRGWLAAQFLSGAHDRQSWSGFIPDLGGNRVLGLALTLAMIAGSVALGQRSLRWSAWAGRAMAAASVLIALWGAGVLAANVGGTAYAYSGPGEGYYEPFSEVPDVYAYDQAGRLVEGARLFDQNGTALELGRGYCANGLPAPGLDLNGGAWSYPLCPADAGPFRSGPGPLTVPPSSPTSGQSETGQPSASTTAASPAPTAATSRPGPTVKPTPRATPTATPSGSPTP